MVAGGLAPLLRPGQAVTDLPRDLGGGGFYQLYEGDLALPPMHVALSAHEDEYNRAPAAPSSRLAHTVGLAAAQDHIVAGRGRPRPWAVTIGSPRRRHSVYPHQNKRRQVSDM